MLHNVHLSVQISPSKMASSSKRELLHHGRRVGEEEKTEIRVVSGETNLIPHIDISVVVAENNSIVKPKC